MLEIESEYIDDTSSLGDLSTYFFKITQNSFKKNKKTFLPIKYPTPLGNIFVVCGKEYKEYYFKKFITIDKHHSYIYEIARVDGYSIIDLDLEILKKGNKIHIIANF